MVFFIKKLIRLIVRRRTKRGSTVCAYFCTLENNDLVEPYSGKTASIHKILTLFESIFKAYGQGQGRLRVTIFKSADTAHLIARVFKSPSPTAFPGTRIPDSWKSTK